MDLSNLCSLEPQNRYGIVYLQIRYSIVYLQIELMRQLTQL